MLGVYTKSHNKWFMSGEKQRWGPLMEEAEMKRFKVAVRIVEKNVLINMMTYL